MHSLYIIKAWSWVHNKNMTFLATGSVEQATAKVLELMQAEEQDLIATTFVCHTNNDVLQLVLPRSSTPTRT